MRDDAIATTAMLGLPGFVVLAMSEYAGEIEQAAETRLRALLRTGPCRWV